MKIFVALGTQDKPFVRLLEKVEELSSQHDITIQAGYTKFVSENMKVYDYLPRKKLEEILKSVDLVICHGGVGIIMQSLNFKRKVIACPRLQKYGEHQNDHQIQIVSNFYSEGYILKFEEGDVLKDVVAKVKDFTPKIVESNNAIFLDKLEKYLKNKCGF